MTTTSFPITGDNITHAQWSSLGAHADGIREGNAFVLSSTTDELTVPSGTKIGCKGFLLDVTADEVLTLPAVTSDTVYRVGVMYDPANEAAAGGPLTLVAPVAGSEGIPAGGAFLPLQDITRRNGVSLNASTVQDYRYFNNGGLVAPSSGLVLPPAEFYAKGASLVLPTGLYLHDGADWVEVEDDTGWRSDGFVMQAGFSNLGNRWRVRNGIAQLVLRAKRTAGAFAADSNGERTDVPVLQVPAEPMNNFAHFGRGSGSVVWDWTLFGANSGGDSLKLVLTSMLPSHTLYTNGSLQAGLTHIL